MIKLHNEQYAYDLGGGVGPSTPSKKGDYTRMVTVERVDGFNCITTYTNSKQLCTVSPKTSLETNQIAFTFNCLESPGIFDHFIVKAEKRVTSQLKCIAKNGEIELFDCLLIPENAAQEVTGTFPKTFTGQSIPNITVETSPMSDDTYQYVTTKDFDSGESKIIPVTINIKGLGYNENKNLLQFDITTSVCLLDNISLSIAGGNSGYFSLYKNREDYNTNTWNVSATYWVDTCKFNVETLKNAFGIQNQSTWEEKYEFTFVMSGTWPTEAPTKPSSDPSKVDYEVVFNPTPSSVGNMPIATVWNRDTVKHTVMVRVKVGIANTPQVMFGNSIEKDVSNDGETILRVESITNVDSRFQMVGNALYVDGNVTKRYGDIDV